jgi:hypothetical protein
MKVVHPDLIHPFLNTAEAFNPVFGLSRRPGEPLPAPPDMKYVEQLQRGERTYKQTDGKADYCYWFLYKLAAKQREAFLGHGGLTAIFLPPDPAAKAPAFMIPNRVRRNPAMMDLITKNDLQAKLDGAWSMKSAFLNQSKEMFGADLEDDPAFRGFPFILPLLESEAFFRHHPDEVRRWFTLFDFYVSESPRDSGVILASKHDIEEELVKLIRDMRNDGQEYRE